jgi:hypothetical protein
MDEKIRPVGAKPHHRPTLQKKSPGLLCKRFLYLTIRKVTCRPNCNRRGTLLQLSVDGGIFPPVRYMQGDNSSSDRPRSVTISVGHPNLDIHDINAFPTVSAVMSAIGVTSGHRVKRSTAVKQ